MLVELLGIAKEVRMQDKRSSILEEASYSKTRRN